MDKLIEFLVQNIEKFGIVGIMLLVILFLFYLNFKIFKYFQSELDKRDNTIKEMTSVLVETSEVMTKLTVTINIQKNEYFSELKVRAEEIKSHISNLFASRNK